MFESIRQNIQTIRFVKLKNKKKEKIVLSNGTL